METIYRFLLGALLVMGGLSAAQAQGDPARGEQLSATCAACHGADGNSAAPTWPKLAGQSERYLLQQLQAFKKGANGGRVDPSMNPLMAALSPQDMADLAAFYASQTMTVGESEAATLKRGEQLYRGGDIAKKITACIACHGPQGLGNNEAGFPRLSGQHAAYVEKQLTAYSDGSRTGTNNIMPMIAARMSSKDRQAVANYVYGLH